MGLFDSIVAILTVTLLLTEVGKWSNSEESTLHYTPSSNESVHNNENHSILDSPCVVSVSRTVPQYVPYTETYRGKAWGLYRPQSRTNYRIEYNVQWSVESKCCEGYVQVGRMCMPHCSHPCERGICVKPNVCKCNAGYRMSHNVTNGRQLCVPVCTNGCVNGTCVDVEVCSCNDGYWMDADGFTCRPVCDIECERNYGYCVEPNVCSCRSGYVRAESNESTTVSLRDRCEPVCDRACTYGRCTAPNICSCNDGYEADESDPRFICKPRCEDGCAFGECTEPGTCTCDDGYKPVNSSTCEPRCSKRCVMGACVAPETCKCQAGYGLLGASKYICMPICENCGNGTCTAPGVCTCNDGYSTVGTLTCEPICSELCVMGTCVAPETCNCNVGYAQLGDSKYICGPACETGCDNGRCTAPEICTCDDGHATDVDGRCAPVCAEECTNGTCTAPNRCTCDEGFAQRNASFCEPVCEGDCQNGDCVGPNQCVCRDNFVPSTRNNSSTECVPACTRNCSGHGVCLIDDETDGCQCYFGWTGSDCDRPTVCVVMMDFVRSDISKLTIYNETNSTIMQAHEDAPYCYQCGDDILDTESLCYVVQSDEANTTSTVGCLLSTDLPCYMAPHFDSSINIVKIVWPLAAILILTSLIAAYLVYCRRQKKKLITANTSSTLYAQEAFATESLLSENVIYL